MLPKQRNRPAEDRFWEKVEKSESCWRWTARTDDYGYGVFRLKPSYVKAHRYAYQLLVGVIPFGLELDHLCRNRWCVNPDHLELVTHAENVRRGRAGAHNKIKTHCKHGHPFDDDNTGYTKSGGRICRACMCAAFKRYRRKKKSGAMMQPRAGLTHCSRGHQFDAENTYVTKSGARACRACHREHRKKYRRRLRHEPTAA